MDDLNDFDGLEKMVNAVTPPPEKIQPVKPSREDLHAYYHDGMIPSKPLPKRHSVEHIRWILKTLYNYELTDITEYKGTRGYDNHKRYRVEDENGKTIIAECTLYQLGCFLEEEGDYLQKKPSAYERYNADIYYFEWHGRPRHFRPISKYLKDIYIEEHGCFFFVYDKDGNYIMKKKKDSQGTKVLRKEATHTKNNGLN